jgi:prevent-host-death family protein
MPNYSVSEAKAKFSEVLEAAANGEDVIVTRHGKPYIKLISVEPKVVDPFDWAELDALVDSLPKMDISAADLIRQMRDEGY